MTLMSRKNNTLKKLLTLHIILMIVMLLIAATACEPALPLEVENQTNQSLIIYVQGVKEFEVAPGETSKGYTASMIYNNYFIEGTDKHGEIIYSKLISWDELHDNDWKMIITSSQKNPYFSLEVENRTELLLYIYLDNTPIGSIEPGACMKKRPLPSDYDTYAIEAASTIENDDVTRIVTVYSQVFTRSELGKKEWKIVIPTPENE